MKKNPKFRIKFRCNKELSSFQIQLQHFIFLWKAIETFYVNDHIYDHSFEERQKQAITALAKWKNRYINLIKENIIYD